MQVIQRFMNLPGGDLGNVHALITAILPLTLDDTIYRIGPVDNITGFNPDGTIVNAGQSGLIYILTSNDATITQILQAAQGQYHMSFQTWSVSVNYGV